VAFLIRDFAPDDQDAVAQLILGGMRQRWGSRFDPTADPDIDDLWASYIDAGGEIVVGELGGSAIATTTLMGCGARDGRILRMSVARSHRGCGFGRLLVAEMVARSRRRGMLVLHVSTDTPWVDAVAFYKACGFVATSESGGDTHFELVL